MGTARTLPTMRRRALLAALGATTAGCLGGPAPPADPSGQSSDQPPSPEPGAELRVADLAVSTTKVAPEKRYLVRITHHYSADAVEREPGDQHVVDVSEVADPAVRAVLEEVLREGELRRDAVPGGLRELTERVDFFTWDAATNTGQTYTHWGVAVYRAHPDRPPVVEFDAALVDTGVSADDPATVAFSLTNVGDHVQKVSSGTVPPFGVLWAEGGGGRVLLWRDYEEEGCVTFSDDGMGVCAIGKLTPHRARPDRPEGVRPPALDAGRRRPRGRRLRRRRHPDLPPGGAEAVDRGGVGGPVLGGAGVRVWRVKRPLESPRAIWSGGRKPRRE